MAGAGAMRDRVTFRTETKIADTGGGYQLGWADISGCVAIPGYFAPERGRERIGNDRVQVSVAGTLRVRSSSETQVVTEGDIVLIGTVPYNIRSVTNPDRRNRWLEMVVERADARGVAV